MLQLDWIGRSLLLSLYFIVVIFLEAALGSAICPAHAQLPVGGTIKGLPAYTNSCLDGNLNAYPTKMQFSPAALPSGIDSITYAPNPSN